MNQVDRQQITYDIDKLSGLVMIDWRNATEGEKAELAKLARDRRLIIFVGSGISVDSGLPTWEGFLDSFIEFCANLSQQYRAYKIEDFFQRELFEDAHSEKTKSPTHVATVLKAKMQTLPQSVRTNVDNDFRKWFYGMFANADPNSKHRLIAETNYPYILTSNYDLLLEDAAKEAGVLYSSLSFWQKDLIAEALYLRNDAIIHVHGAWTDVVLDKIILTSEDYTRIIKKGEPGFSFAIQSLFLNYSTLFVGYGASDPHLEDLVEEFSYYFGFPQSSNLSRNYLVVLRKRAGRILNEYKGRMRTELIVIDDLSDYEDILKTLKAAAPRALDLF